jgi:hypothetical protein
MNTTGRTRRLAALLALSLPALIHAQALAQTLPPAGQMPRQPRT